MKTLLNCVNEILKSVDVLEGDTGLLTSLTDSARQTYIDTAVQVTNEVIDEVYSLLDQSKPNQLAEATITLVTNDQDYELASDLVTLLPKFGLINESTSHVIKVLGDDGYQQIILGDLGRDDTGLPSQAAIRPTDGELFMDRKPTAAHNGDVYKYRYHKELELSVAADEVPFGNTVFRAMVQAAAELWKLRRHKDFSQGVFDASLGRAARLIKKTPMRDSWMPSQSTNVTDPFES